MSIIVNGTSIPANGDYIVVNGVKAEKVIVNGSTVWDISGSSTVRLRCTAEDRWGQSGCVQFGRTRIY